MDFTIHSPSLDGTFTIDFIEKPYSSATTIDLKSKVKEITSVRFIDKDNLRELRNLINAYLGETMSIPIAAHQEVKNALETAINKCINADKKILTQELEINALNNQIKALNRQIKYAGIILKTISENLLFTVELNLPSGNS